MSRPILTPKEVSELLRCSTEKALVFIRSGELPAINTSTNKSGRPRYLVKAEDLETFIAGRSSGSRPAPTARSRRKRDSAVPSIY